jgi:hypothetical protein
MLSGLRQMIDSKIEISVPGAAFTRDAELPDGVELLEGLHGVEQALARWSRPMKDQTGAG